MNECGKTPFRSRKAALQGATSVARRNGDRRLSAYLCDKCHSWHLTSKASRTS